MLLHNLRQCAVGWRPLWHAVIDYERDEMILKKVNDKKVVKLERAESGHQLFPMATDIYHGAAAAQQF